MKQVSGVLFGAALVAALIWQFGANDVIGIALSGLAVLAFAFIIFAVVALATGGR